jgi:hypothetical protein
MALKHAKTDTIPDWTQATLDAQIALGNYPPGTLLADIVLPSDWNDDHVIDASGITFHDNTVQTTAASVGGSDSQIQYNNGGSFGGDANFTYDDVNKIAELTGNTESFTIGNPTGSITVTDAGATVSGNSPYSGDYVTHLFKIYAYRDVDSTRLYSTTPITGSIYLETGENYRKLNFQFAAVANASGYILVWDGGGFGYYPYSKDIGNSVNYTDDGQVSYIYSGIDYSPPNGNSVTFNLAPLWVGKTLDLATKNVEIFKYGTEENVLKWDAVNQRLKLSTSADALDTLNADVVASNLTSANATITSLAGTHSTGTIASAVNVLTAASGNTGSFHDALISVGVTGGNAVRSVSNNTLRLNPTRKTAVINGSTELGQGTSGTMLSITAANAYAAFAMKAGSAGGLHFFQIINSSDVVKSVFRDDGNAIFGSTNYSNYGRGSFIDDGFSGSPAAGQLSTLGYWRQDDENVYGWGVGNSTYDINNQKVNIVGVALNAGGGWIGTPDSAPLSFRTDNTARLTISSAGISTFAGSVDLRAGTATASTYPLKFTSGALLTTPVAGVEEFLTDKRYTTITTGTARKEYTLNDIALTSGRVSFNTTNGRQTDSANFTYTTNRLSPTYLTLAAGTATAGTCPLVMTSGTLLTTAIAGGKEFLTDKFYATITTGAARKELTLNDIALTSGRVPFTTTNGRLTDSANLAWSGTALSVTGNLTLGAAGNKINITEGANASCGVVTLVAGVATVNTTAVTANSRIFLTRQTTSGTLGTSVDVTARVAGTSFTITSNGSILDTSTVAWLIIN